MKNTREPEEGWSTLISRTLVDEIYCERNLSGAIWQTLYSQKIVARPTVHVYVSEILALRHGRDAADLNRNIPTTSGLWESFPEYLNQ